MGSVFPCPKSEEMEVGVALRFMGLMRQRIPAAAFTHLLLSARQLQGQERVPPPGDLSRLLKVGDTIRVTLRDRQVRTGRLIVMDPASLTIEEAGTRKTVVPGDVAAVDRRGDSLKNGTIIGLTIGAGAAGTLGAVFEGTEPGETGRPVAGLLGGALYGAGIGLLCDVLRKGWTATYRAPAQTTLNVAPVIDDKRYGAMVNLSLRTP